MHTVFSGLLVTLMVLLIVIRRDIPTAVIATLFAVYIIGNGIIHARRDDFKPEVIVEYVLLAAAVFIVLVSAL
jgi:hypothetical protein